MVRRTIGWTALRRSVFILSAALILGVLFLSACDTTNSPPPAPQIPGLAATLAAQTLSAQGLVRPVIETPIPAITEALLAVTEAPQLPTATPLIALSPAAGSSESFVLNVPLGTPGAPVSGTLDYPAVPVVQGNCNNAAKFIKDVTVPDEMVVESGQKFTKIWQIQNVGTCSWTPDYSLVHVWGEKMEGVSPTLLGQIIQPGEIIDLALDLVAPVFPACYQGDWMIEDTAGNRFGTGYGAENHIWVAVTVDMPGMAGNIIRSLGVGGGG